MKAIATLFLAAAMSATAATAQTAPPRPGIAHLTAGQRYDIKHAGEWHAGCPVGLSQLRVLTYRYYGFDHQLHLGQIVVNAKVAGAVAKAFHRLLSIRFPVREGAFLSTYGPNPDQSGDVTASFECRQAAASPCTGGRTGSWSMHAYGEAVDLDPRENPYVGCGMTRDKTAISYMKRSDVRPGMVTPSIWHRTFGYVGWGWGGSWAGSTKDYMHFSINGH